MRLRVALRVWILTLRPWPWSFLQLSGGLQYLDAEYTEGVLEESGVDVQHAPEWTWNLAATATRSLGTGEGYLRTDYSYMGDHFSNPTFQPPESEQDRQELEHPVGLAE